MQADDPDGLYDTLGVAPSASRDEIRRAYRTLAKQTHPDTAPQKSNISFQQITLAYRTLSDQKARVLYDRTGLQSNRGTASKPKVRPASCSCCGKVTAQPREVTYRRVYSLLVTSLKRDVTALYCAKCARQEGLRSSAISSMFGWWAIPLGPYHTIRSVFGNALSSRHDPAMDAAYLWQNSLAFLHEGKFKLGYALAQKVTSAEDPDLADKARRLVRNLERKGISAGKAKLSLPWRNRPSVILSHLLILSAIPVTITGVLWLQPWQPRPAMVTMAAPTPASNAMGGPLAQAFTPLISVTCPHKPVNGEILYRVVSNKTASHQLQLHNSAATAAIVKIRSAFSRRLISAIFVAPNSSATLENVPDGYFNFQYGFGADLARNCRTFINTTTTWQVPETANFRSMNAGVPLKPQQITLMLADTPVEGRKIMKIGLDVFNAN